MLKIEIVETGGFPRRTLKVEGELPAANDEESFEFYREDARRMLTGLADEFNALGAKQVLAAALDIISTPEGENWLRDVCNGTGSR